MARGRARQAPRWQGVAVFMVAGLALAGCAHTPSWAPWHKPDVQPAAEAQPTPPPHRPEPRHRKTARPAPHTAKAPPEAPKVAMLDPNALVGLKPPAVARLLGSPTGTGKDEMSLVWTYAADDCRMRVYFYPDLKTADFHVLKFTLSGADGKPLADEAPCRRKLLALKANDTG